MNSGLVTYPTKYKKLGYALGLTIWEPVPPEQYVSLGHVATTGEDEPSVKEVPFYLLYRCAKRICSVSHTRLFTSDVSNWT